MKMRITIDGKTRSLKSLGEVALVNGLEHCPRCKRKGEVHVRGDGKHVEGRDTYVSQGHAQCCGKLLGEIRVVVSTIFGLEEDEDLYAMVVRNGGRVF